MPKSWPLPRKERKFIIKGSGPHSLKSSIPSLIVLRDILKVVKTKKEAKKVLNENLVLVDNHIIKDEKFGVGFLDRIYIKKLEKAFTVSFTKKGKLQIQEIDKEKANKKPCKIIGKTILKYNKIQVNLYDGKNFIITQKNINVGDSALLDLKTSKIIGYLKLQKGAHVVIIGGKHLGSIGEISEINDKIFIISEGKTLDIQKENVFVIE